MSSMNIQRIIGGYLFIAIVLAQRPVELNSFSPQNFIPPKDKYQNYNRYPYRGYSEYPGPTEDAWLSEIGSSFPSYPLTRFESDKRYVGQFAPFGGGARVPAYTSADSLKPEWIRSFGSGLRPGYDRGMAVAVDREGNIYATGMTISPPYGLNIITFKYSPDGTELWRAEYDGPAHKDDVAHSIALDDQGAIFIGGESNSTTTGSDFIVLKYSGEGDLMWSARYDGPSSYWDHLQGIVPDNQGGVYAGGMVETGYQSACATVRFDSLGNEIWSSIYEETGFFYSFNGVIAIDPQGNLLQGGTHVNRDDYTEKIIIVKRRPDGELDWVAEYSGESLRRAKVSDLTTDAQGSVYVVGEIDGVFHTGMITLKYDSAGTEQWNVHDSLSYEQDIGMFVQVDTDGFAHVTGNVRSNMAVNGWITVKYSPSGEEVWRSRYNSPDGGPDYVAGMDLDELGNLYVTGWHNKENTPDFWVTIKYDRVGDVVWIARYTATKVGNSRPRGIALGLNGEVYLTGYTPRSGTDLDFVTVKYSAQGIEQWVAMYDSAPFSADRALAMAVDNEGQVYVAAESDAGRTELLLNKYSPTGDLVWSERYANSRNTGAAFKAIDVSNSGNIYVAGLVGGEAYRTSDFIVLQYDPDGHLNWFATYDSPGNSQDVLKAMALDQDGNVYVTGNCYVVSDDGEVQVYGNATIKYSAAGEELWVEQYQRPDGVNGITPVGIAVDRSGVYILGNTFADFDDYGGGHQDMTTLKYSHSGRLKWAAHYNGSKSHNEGARDVGVDGNGNVIVTGWSDDPYRLIVTIKYNHDGEQTWVATYGGGEGSFDRPEEMAVDFIGNIYINAYNSNYADGSFNMTIKYNSSGRLEWVRKFRYPYAGTGTSYDYPMSVAVDGLGGVYVTGGSRTPLEAGMVVTVKYNSNGDEQWIDAYSSATYIKDSPADLVTDGWGGVYVAANSGEYNWGTITTLKYIEAGRDGLPDKFSFSQNFPNPFNSSTTFRFILDEPANTTLRVFNILGQHIATLVRGQLGNGEYKFSWIPNSLPSGIYLYQLQVGRKVVSRKMLYLK